MVLDMEGEFYKLAKDILSKPKNLYKMAAIGPKSGRLNLLGADGFVVVGGSMLRSITRGPGKKAYRYGKSSGKDAFGALLSEFDEEIERLPSKKLMNLAILLSRQLGWGNLNVINLSRSTGEIVMTGEKTIELSYGKAKHHMLTCGFITGISSVVMRRKMKGEVTKEENEKVTFSIRPEASAD